MDEIRELLEQKLQEFLKNKEKCEIKEIKEAAAVLRELRDMEAPVEEETVSGGVVELG